jgi:hypothetical protein
MRLKSALVQERREHVRRSVTRSPCGSSLVRAHRAVRFVLPVHRVSISCRIGAGSFGEAHGACAPRGNDLCCRRIAR